MLRRVLAVALNTYRESVRARILLGLAGVAFAAALYSILVGAYTLKYAPRVVSNIGTASPATWTWLEQRAHASPSTVAGGRLPATAFSSDRA